MWGDLLDYSGYPVGMYRTECVVNLPRISAQQMFGSRAKILYHDDKRLRGIFGG